jgi:hypothetical protein
MWSAGVRCLPAHTGPSGGDHPPRLISDGNAADIRRARSAQKLLLEIAVKPRSSQDWGGRSGPRPVRRRGSPASSAKEFFSHTAPKAELPGQLQPVEPGSAGGVCLRSRLRSLKRLGRPFDQRVGTGVQGTFRHGLGPFRVRLFLATPDGRCL